MKLPTVIVISKGFWRELAIFTEMRAKVKDGALTFTLDAAKKQRLYFRSRFPHRAPLGAKLSRQIYSRCLNVKRIPVVFD
jgi:hypothetical protein